jgi:Bacterial PH domain
VVLYAMQARSPMSVLEQLTASLWTAMLAACAVVVTNQRILFFPVKHDGKWRESVRAVAWGDLEEIKPKGLLVKQVTFKTRDGSKSTFTNVRSGDGKKIAAIAAVLLTSAAGEITSAHSIVQLCPDCRGMLTAGNYQCPGCGLVFKNEKTMILRSIFLPGGGYFYTGHPLVAMLPAVVETLFLLEVLAILLVGFASPQAVAQLLSSIALLALFWALETAVTILHCRRFVREFIPLKRVSAEVPQPR